MQFASAPGSLIDLQWQIQQSESIAVFLLLSLFCFILCEGVGVSSMVSVFFSWVSVHGRCRHARERESQNKAEMGQKKSLPSSEISGEPNYDGDC